MSHKYNDLLAHSDGFVDRSIVQQIMDINFESKKMNIEIDKTPSNNSFAKKIIVNLNRLTKSFEIQQADAIVDLFDIIEKLDLQIDISEAQNIYFSRIFIQMGDILEEFEKSHTERDKDYLEVLFAIGSKLNINTEFYKTKFTKILLNAMEE